MKERPILFSAPMVRALLDGSKTQTRRPCKYPIYANGFKFDGHDFLCHNDYLPPSATLMDVKRGGIEYTTSDHAGWDSECPYGQPGDRLWVREAHWWFKDEPDHETGYFPPKLTADDVEYRADGDDGRKVWRPSIHMPRWASRILLEVTGARLERLQDISHADAWLEGVGAPGTKYDFAEGIDLYRTLWESINGPESWAANPWVWVVEFKVMQP